MKKGIKRKKLLKFNPKIVSQLFVKPKTGICFFPRRMAIVVNFNPYYLNLPTFSHKGLPISSPGRYALAYYF